MNLPFNILPARPEHCLAVFELANDPFVRQFSCSNKAIVLDEHCVWYAQRLKKPNSPFFLAFAEDELAAYVRFEANGQNSAIISIAIAKNWRGQNLGASLIKASCSLACAAGLHHIIAWILPENKASIKVFSQANFVNTGLNKHEQHLALLFKFKHNTCHPFN